MAEQQGTDAIRFFPEGQLLVSIASALDSSVSDLNGLLREKLQGKVNDGIYNALTTAKSTSVIELKLEASKEALSVFRLDLTGDATDDVLISIVDTLLDPKNDIVDPLRQNGLPAIISVSPNWYVSPTPQPQIDGGSGAIPIPGTQLEDMNSFFTVGFDQLLARLDGERNEKQPFSVAVLDTSWEEDKLKSLLSANGITVFDNAAHLNVIYQPTVDALSTLSAGDGQANHPYDMISHGIFAASIIARIAPYAGITLIRVLNDRGVGTLESYLIGLQEAYQLATTSAVPFVINSSLSLRIPLSSQVSAKLPAWNGLATNYNAVTTTMLSTVQTLADNLYQNGKAKIILAAAAGNDSDLANTRYPASLASMVGVGAIDKQQNPQPYTNKADVQNSFVAFGGDAVLVINPVPPVVLPVTNPSVMDNLFLTTLGISGVYLDATFPPVPSNPTATPNSTGIALWAGTSFACPVFAGLVGVCMADYGMNAGFVIASLKDGTGDTEL